MRFRYRVPVIVRFVILLCVISQSGWAGSPPANPQFGTHGTRGPSVMAGIASVGLALMAPPSEQVAAERPPRRTLSSEAENGLLLLLGIVLLLTFTAAKLWPKDDREPTK